MTPTLFGVWIEFIQRLPRNAYLPQQIKLLKYLKGHSQRGAHAHTRTSYHFIANLHITETRYILFLTKYDKNNIEDEQKHTGFSVKV